MTDNLKETGSQAAFVLPEEPPVVKKDDDVLVGWSQAPTDFDLAREYKAAHPHHRSALDAGREAGLVHPQKVELPVREDLAGLDTDFLNDIRHRAVKTGNVSFVLPSGEKSEASWYQILVALDIKRERSKK